MMICLRHRCCLCILILSCCIVVCISYSATKYLTTSLAAREQPYWSATPAALAAILCLVYSCRKPAPKEARVSRMIDALKLVTFLLCFGSSLVNAVAAYYAGYRAYDISTYHECLPCSAYSTFCPSDYWSAYPQEGGSSNIHNDQVLNCVCIKRISSLLDTEHQQRFKHSGYYFNVNGHFGCEKTIQTLLKLCLGVMSTLCGVVSLCAFVFAILIYKDRYYYVSSRDNLLLLDGGMNLGSGSVVRYRRVGNKEDNENEFSEDVGLNADCSNLQRFEAVDTSLDRSTLLAARISTPISAWNEDESSKNGDSNNRSTNAAILPLQSANNASLIVVDGCNREPSPLYQPIQKNHRAKPTKAVFEGTHRTNGDLVHPETTVVPSFKPIGVNQLYRLGNGVGIYEEIPANKNQPSQQRRLDMDDLLFKAAEFILKSPVPRGFVSSKRGISADTNEKLSTNNHIAASANGLTPTSCHQRLVVDTKEFWV